MDSEFFLTGIATFVIVYSVSSWIRRAVVASNAGAKRTLKSLRLPIKSGDRIGDFRPQASDNAAIDYLQGFASMPFQDENVDHLFEMLESGVPVVAEGDQNLWADWNQISPHLLRGALKPAVWFDVPREPLDDPAPFDQLHQATALVISWGNGLVQEGRFKDAIGSYQAAARMANHTAALDNVFSYPKYFNHLEDIRNGYRRLIGMVLSEDVDIESLPEIENIMPPVVGYRAWQCYAYVRALEIVDGMPGCEATLTDQGWNAELLRKAAALDKLTVRKNRARSQLYKEYASLAAQWAAHPTLSKDELTFAEKAWKAAMKVNGQIDELLKLARQAPITQAKRYLVAETYRRLDRCVARILYSTRHGLPWDVAVFQDECGTDPYSGRQFQVQVKPKWLHIEADCPDFMQDSTPNPTAKCMVHVGSDTGPDAFRIQTQTES